MKVHVIHTTRPNWPEVIRTTNIQVEESMSRPGRAYLIHFTDGATGVRHRYEAASIVGSMSGPTIVIEVE